MLLRTIIADDERIIRDGLRKYVPWERLGYRVTAELENGRQVLEHLEKEHADVLLLDIRMPEMSGLEVMEQLAKRHPGVRTIVLSGYAEFEYARRALTLNAVDYLLKPVDIEVLSGKLLRLRDEVYNSQTQQLLRDLGVRASGTSGDIALPTSLLDFHAGHRWLRISAHARSGENEDSREGPVFAEFGDLRLTLLRESRNAAFVLLTSRSPLTKEETRDALAAHIGAASAVAVGEAVAFDRVDGVSAAYRSASALRELAKYYSFGAGQSGVPRFIWAEDAGPRRDEDEGWGDEETERLTASLVEREEAKFADGAERLAHLVTAEAGLPTQAAVCRLYGKAFARLAAMLRELGYDPAMVAGPTPAEDELFAYPRFADLRKRLYDYGISAIHHLHVNGKSRKQAIVAEAKRLLEELYAEPVGLDQIADRLQVSKEYLSVIFKEVAQVNFNLYIRQLRMERAARLLRDERQLKILEIARLVGYPDPKYFCRVFKAQFGTHPDDFRRSASGR